VSNPDAILHDLLRDAIQEVESIRGRQGAPARRQADGAPATPSDGATSPPEWTGDRAARSSWARVGQVACAGCLVLPRGVATKAGGSTFGG
jgi:hypothetical protein